MGEGKDKGFVVGRYEDAVHAEVQEDLQVGEYGYKYRLIEGRVMPPYITPGRYALSRRLRMRQGDVCYTAFPKSGSTWLAYILYLIVNKGENPSDNTLRNCLHWVASSFTYPRSEKELDAWPSPRLFKSHMPYSMAVGGVPAEGPCKHVYIARNPKDVCVSYYKFESDKSWSGYYAGTWEHWLQMFLNGRVQRGDWFDHVLSWWEHRDSEFIHFLKYEDLLDDFDETLKKLADFLNYPMPPDLIASIRGKTEFHVMQSNGFSGMKEIEEFGEFFRKGQIGSWKERFTVAQNEEFDRICRKRMWSTGLDFKYE